MYERKGNSGMSMNIVITLAMMVAIIVLVLKNLCNAGIVMAGVPIVAAFLMGFSLEEITGFVNSGMNSVMGTISIMMFAVAYFGVLHEAGVFKVLVNSVMKRLKNGVLGVLIATGIITCLTQLDGSGMTTALCTIPPMRPIYEKMKIRREALILIEGIGSGVMTMLPWAPGICEACAYSSLDVYEVFRWMVPLLVFSVIAFFLFCIPVSIVERRHGAGMTQEEFNELREELSQKIEFPYGEKIAIFDGALTLILMALLLAGLIKTNIAFVIGYVILVVVNFRTPKEQGDYLRRQAPTLVNLLFTMLGVGVLVGVNNGTGAMAELADLVVASGGSMVRHIPVIVTALSVILGITCANAKLSVIMPAVCAMAAPFGFSPIQITGAIFATGAVSANINFFSATPYLSLSLAGVEMKDNLKYCFLPMYGFSLLMTLFLVVSGRLPF